MISHSLQWQNRTEQQQQHSKKCLSLLPYRNTQVPKTICISRSLPNVAPEKKKPDNVLHQQHQEIVIKMKTNTNTNQKRTKIMYNTQYRFYRHVPKGNLYAILVCSSASSRSFVRPYVRTNISGRLMCTFPNKCLCFDLNLWPI